MVSRLIRSTNREEQTTAAAFSPRFKDASGRIVSRRLWEKIENSGTLDNWQRKTVAIHAGWGKNEHGKALCHSPEKAHQIHRMFGSQEQESGSVSGQ
jgi:DNA primase